MTRQFTIATLADHPTAVPVLARWCYDQWGRADGYTLAHELDRFARALHATRASALPLVFIALDGATVVACAQLKTEAVFHFPEQTCWLGPVYVAAAYRGNHLAEHLIDALVQHARQSGVTHIHLQTEMFSGGLYARLGWKPMLRAVNHGVDVLVMRRDLVDAFMLS